MSFAAEWTAGVRARFVDREVLDREAAYRECWDAFPRAAVDELFDLVQVEYGLEPGLLRPADPLRLLLEPVPTKNPLKWLVFQAKTEDRQSELDHRLTRRLQRAGRKVVPGEIVTLDDYLRAWCSVPADDGG
jgi:hypothetical protein